MQLDSHSSKESNYLHHSHCSQVKHDDGRRRLSFLFHCRDEFSDGGMEGYSEYIESMIMTEQVDM